MINKEINRLLHFGLQKHLLEPEDVTYATNRLLDLLGLTEFTPEPVSEDCQTATPILEAILDYAVSQKKIEDTTTERDLLDTRIMDCLMPRPSQVVRAFWETYRQSPEKATDDYYQMSIASNYIRKDRTDKNILWKTPTEYGELDITINLSKPEKDPKEIAKAKLVKASSYPKCLLCRENEGFAGNFHHPARNTHRLIPLSFAGEDWFLQYSPYTYYNEHCIVLNARHTPMSIRKKTFENLLGFVEVLPHYFLGSNADLPIVGGSILSHDHYQGGRYVFAMEKAPVEEYFTLPGFADLSAGRVKWPMSVLRLSSSDKERLIDCADMLLQKWRAYSDPSVEILASSQGEPHNTITPIARKRGEQYELDLVFRNNRTSAEHPLGIFHPHAEVHHIKKENIGLIEVMGLAVLPARLKEELQALRPYLLAGHCDFKGNPLLEKHQAWAEQILQKEIKEENVDEILRQAVGETFLTGLCHAGVFKDTPEGKEAFRRFLNS